jgi:1-acyl-sn-glycerol-3-phosphate acyltransferase
MKLSSLYAYGEFGVLTAAWLPVVAAARGLSAGDPTHRLSGRALRGLGRAITRASMTWRFDVDGAAPRADRPYVVVSNHASLADPLLLSFLPLYMRFDPMEVLFHAPFVGCHLRLAGHTPRRPDPRSSAHAMYDACVATLKRGLSVFDLVMR